MKNWAIAGIVFGAIGTLVSALIGIGCTAINYWSYTVHSQKESE